MPRFDNQLKGNPEVLSRLGHQAESKKTSVFTAALHNTKGATPKCWLEKQNPQGDCKVH
jgi:hypothetical protein